MTASLELRGSDAVKKAMGKQGRIQQLRSVFPFGVTWGALMLMRDVSGMGINPSCQQRR